MEKIKLRNSDLENEVKEKENKYLDLYIENNNQHEEISKLKEQIV